LETIIEDLAAQSLGFVIFELQTSL